jgi:N-acyl homoserine lactone hydrolase
MAVFPLELGGAPVALHPMVVGYEPIPHAGSVDGGDPARFLLEPVTATAVEFPTGWVLVDSGFNVAVVRDPVRRAQLLNFENYTPVLPPGDPLWDAVARAGLAKERLAACVISHAHVDHTGGVPTLPAGVPVVLQRREWEWVLAGAGQSDAVINSDLADAVNQVVTIDGDTLLAPGLVALDTSGHTPGHQSVSVELASGRRVVLACDAADLAENVNVPTRCGWTVGADGPERAQVAIERLAELARAGVEVWPGHDPEWEEWVVAGRGAAVVIR